MQMKLAALLLALAGAACAQTYIQLPTSDAFATLQSRQGRVILSDLQKDCPAPRKFALLINSVDGVNTIGCWFYDSLAKRVYVKVAYERAYRYYEESAFKLAREDGRTFQDTLYEHERGAPVPPAERQLERQARPGQQEQ